MVIRRFGGPEVIAAEEVERPAPGPGELLVRVVATSVNPVDFKTRAGQFPPVGEDALPVVLGRDVAGIVDAVGDGVDRFAPGDAVYAMPGFDRGTYAEFVLLKSEEAAGAPARLPLAEAGAVPLAALTAWQGLMRHGSLERGQRVMIHGGAGGVGHFAVQFARAAGATVFATASGADRDLLVELGAEVAIDYEAERFEERATEIDLVLDLIGGETQERSWAVLARGGIIVSTLQDPDPARARAAGARPGVHFLCEPSGEDLTEIAALLDTDQVRVVVSDRFPLARVAAAQQALEAGGVRGKILVTVADA